MKPNFDDVINSTLYETNTTANAQWNALGCSGRIPLEPDQGHWDEKCLAHEVMTPSLLFNTTNFLSNLTAGAMEDMGYDVDYAKTDDFTLSDLGNCTTSCPEASSSGGRRLDSLPRRKPAEETILAVKNEFKKDLIDFHTQLKKSGFIQGKGGYYVMEQVDALVLDGDGHVHTVTVTYDMVKDM